MVSKTNQVHITQKKSHPSEDYVLPCFSPELCPVALAHCNGAAFSPLEAATF